MADRDEQEWPHDPRLVQAAIATALGDEVPPDAEEVWLRRFRDRTLLVLAVVAHAHGASLQEIRRAVGGWRLGVRLSLRGLGRAGLVERERRPGPDHWFATRAGTRLGVVPYVTRLLGAVVPRYRGRPWAGWSVGRFSAVGTEHGPPVFRPSFALAEVDDPEALAEVIRTGTKDDRAYALTKLIALNDPRSVAVLREVAGRHGDDEPLARRAATALGSFDTRASIDALIEIAASRDSIMREAAARSLGRLGAHEATATLVELTSYPSALVRAAAVRALERIGEESVVRDIAPVLADRDPQVRRYARHALIRLGAVDELRRNPRRLAPLRIVDCARARASG